MSETPIVTPIDPKTLESGPRTRVKTVKPNNSPLIFLGVVIAGIVLGYYLSVRNVPGSGKVVKGDDIIQTENEVGSTDTATFRDTAKGVLESGGSNGEGTHKLTRDGGPSQTVYLISSIVDLDQYAGKKVEVWGETIRAQKVGWLMDVGRLKIIE